MNTGSSIQTAMVLDELPAEVLTEIEDNQESLETIRTALKKPDVNLAGYFTNITDPEEQVDFTAKHILAFFKQRRERKKTQA
jgi:serine kinase of HPr protein (carbohydrate metabolism regulator)